MVPGVRTVTVAAGHGKKAARHIDAYLRRRARGGAQARDGHVRQAPRLVLRRRSEAVPAGAARLDARTADVRARSSAASIGRRRGLRGQAVPLVRQLLRVRRLLRRLPRGRRHQARHRAIATASTTTAARVARPASSSARCHAIEMGRRTCRERVVMDGNEAAASVAYRLNEVFASTRSPRRRRWPSWPTSGRPSGSPTSGAPSRRSSRCRARAAPRARCTAPSRRGALATTFTASQGLLLMIPNMYKIAGELTPAVFHVAARALATHALSIFGDHSDVMAARATGFAHARVGLGAGGARPRADRAGGDAASRACPSSTSSTASAPRTSSNKIELLADDDLRALVTEELVARHRGRALSPDRPFIRGTAQNPDVSSRRARPSTRSTRACPASCRTRWTQLAALTGRRYQLVRLPRASRGRARARLMGSGAETARETVERLSRAGERVGVVEVRLYRPFSASSTSSRRCRPTVAPRSPCSTARRSRARSASRSTSTCVARSARRTTGGLRRSRRASSAAATGSRRRSSRPAMVDGVFDELATRPADAATSRSASTTTSTAPASPFDPTSTSSRPARVRAVFFGLGSDGTVGANKNTIKIIGEETDMHAQGYFVYDSKKSGSQTDLAPALRPEPIRCAYLIQPGQLRRCHQFGFLEQFDVLRVAAPGGAMLLLDCPYGPGARSGTACRARCRSTILDEAARASS